MSFPHPENNGQPVQWTGKKFDCHIQPGVLLYDMPNMPEGWNDDLTDFHAEAGLEEHPLEQASIKLTMKVLRKYSPKHPGHVLEIGCSNGFLLRALRNSQPELEVVGADIIDKPLTRLAAELHDAKVPTPLLRFDLTSCPLPDSSCKAVIARNVLEHIEDDRAAVREVSRILQPGGVFIVELPYNNALFDDYDSQLHHYRRYDDAMLRSLLASEGFAEHYYTHLGFLVYPAFWLVKKWRRRMAVSASRAESKADTQRAKGYERLIAFTSKTVFRLAFALENKLGEKFSFPAGIRCFGVFKKLP